MPQELSAADAIAIEFEAVARSALGDDPEASSFSVDDVGYSATAGVTLECSGVPLGRRAHQHEGWTPDRPMMVELLRRTWLRRYRRWSDANGWVQDPDRLSIADLKNRWPGVLDCPFECGPGWIDLIEATTEWLAEQGELIRFEHVHQKYGGLRLVGGARHGGVGMELSPWHKGSDRRAWNKRRRARGSERRVPVLGRKRPSLRAQASQLFAGRTLREKLAGVLGFEPRNAGTKNRCLTTWRHPNLARFLHGLPMVRNTVPDV